jgi:hypothetical protein
MGFSHSWIAVRGVTRERALEALGMEISDIQTDYLDGVALIDWQDNWLLAISDDSADAFDGDLAQLAALGDAVACSVQEDVMYSEARGYEAGKEIWRVVHDPNEDESLYSLQINGKMPQPFDAIARETRAEQDKEGGEDADVDFIFEVPAKLAASICGFKLDESDPDESQYRTLNRIGARGNGKAGFFARLFGRS